MEGPLVGGRQHVGHPPKLSRDSRLRVTEVDPLVNLLDPDPLARLGLQGRGTVAFESSPERPRTPSGHGSPPEGGLGAYVVIAARRTDRLETLAGEVPGPCASPRSSPSSTW